MGRPCRPARVATRGASKGLQVERSTPYVMLVKLTSCAADYVVVRIQRHVQHLPSELCQTLTWDRGHGMAAHQAFTVAMHIPVYFRDPPRPWQRGTSENTEVVRRPYFPKFMDLLRISQPRLNAVARELNHRPRATHDFRSSVEKFNELLR